MPKPLSVSAPTLFSVLCIASLGLSSSGLPARAETPAILPATQCVILLHGMGRGARSMAKLEKHLEGSGFNVTNVDYPSTSETLNTLVTDFVGTAVADCTAKGAERVHFVTHSLGGILVRKYLQDETLPDGSRIVMLAPPNHGSEIASKLKNFPVYKWATGPAGQTLGIEDSSVPNGLGAVDAEIGIIAGNFSTNPVFSTMIPGDDDGKVSVEHTQLDEMQDFIVLRASHPFIMRKKSTLRQTAHFLNYGRFDHSQQ